MKVQFFFLTHKPAIETFQGEIPLPSLEADESLMSIKMRIAVQASEKHKRNITVYDFILALVNKGTFTID